LTSRKYSLSKGGVSLRGGVSLMISPDDDYNSIAFQAADTYDIEGCEFSKKFKTKSSRDMKKLMGFVGD